MDAQSQMKLGLWLATKQQQPWERGKNDCCTLFMEYHDHMHGTNTLDALYGRYNDLKGAIRTARNFLTVDEWFPQNGYIRVEQPVTGDIAMVQQRYFPSAYIICMGLAWSISDEYKRMTKHILEEPRVEYSIWRHEKWA